MATVIRSPEALKDMTANTFVGTLPQMVGSSITFADNAKNNIIFCDKQVTLYNSSIQICGSNSVIFFSSSRHRYWVTASIYSNSVLYFGRDNSFTSLMHIIMSEQKHVFIGDDGLFSIDIWIRNADPHLIYSCDTRQRINPSQSVFVGDHVWLGQEARLLKGTRIESGSIIGGMSVVAGKQVGHNASWAGNPAKCIKDGIFWDRTCVHGWLDEDTRRSMDWDTFRAGKIDRDAFIFSHDPKEYVSYDQMDQAFSTGTPEQKLAYLKALPTGKNRFVRPDGNPTPAPAPKSRLPWGRK